MSLGGRAPPIYLSGPRLLPRRKPATPRPTSHRPPNAAVSRFRPCEARRGHYTPPPPIAAGLDGKTKPRDPAAVPATVTAKVLPRARFAVLFGLAFSGQGPSSERQEKPGSLASGLTECTLRTSSSSRSSAMLISRPAAAAPTEADRASWQDHTLDEPAFACGAFIPDPPETLPPELPPNALLRNGTKGYGMGALGLKSRMKMDLSGRGLTERDGRIRISRPLP